MLSYRALVLVQAAVPKIPETKRLRQQTSISPSSTAWEVQDQGTGCLESSEGPRPR